MKEVEKDKNYHQHNNKDEGGDGRHKNKAEFAQFKQKMKTVEPLKRKQWQGGKRKVGMQKRKRK